MGGSRYSELCYVVKICWGSVWKGSELMHRRVLPGESNVMNTMSRCLTTMNKKCYILSE